MSPPFLHIQIYKFLERPAFHPTGRIFYKGRKLRKQGILVLRSYRPFWKKTVRRMEKGQLTLRNPFCLSAASFTDFSKVTFFQVFWKTWPSIFVAMTKVRTGLFPGKD